MDIRPVSRKQRWTPTYMVGGNPFFVEFEPLHECPVSYITEDPEVMEILMTVNKGRLAHHASGASLFGPDFSAWPPWAAEAVIAIEQERMVVDQAEQDAVRIQSAAAGRRRAK